MNNMFPHTITIINIVNGEYHKKVVNNVFYVSEKILSQDGNGEKYTNTHRCIFSQESLKDYQKIVDFKTDTEHFTINVNDFIVKGEIDDVSSQNELKNKGYDYFLIKTISDNSDYGSINLRNIEVTD